MIVLISMRISHLTLRIRARPDSLNHNPLPHVRQLPTKNLALGVPCMRLVGWLDQDYTLLVNNNTQLPALPPHNRDTCTMVKSIRKLRRLCAATTQPARLTTHTLPNTSAQCRSLSAKKTTPAQAVDGKGVLIGYFDTGGCSKTS